MSGCVRPFPTIPCFQKKRPWFPIHHARTAELLLASRCSFPRRFLNESFAPYTVVNPAEPIPQSKYSNRIFCVYNEICKTIEPYNKDPRFADIWIQLGTYSICLGQPDAARNLIKLFDELNVSVKFFGSTFKMNAFDLKP